MRANRLGALLAIAFVSVAGLPAAASISASAAASPPFESVSYEVTLTVEGSQQTTWGQVGATPELCSRTDAALNKTLQATARFYIRADKGPEWVLLSLHRSLQPGSGWEVRMDVPTPLSLSMRASVGPTIADCTYGESFPAQTCAIGIEDSRSLEVTYASGPDLLWDLTISGPSREDSMCHRLATIENPYYFQASGKRRDIPKSRLLQGKAFTVGGSTTQSSGSGAYRREVSVTWSARFVPIKRQAPPPAAPKPVAAKPPPLPPPPPRPNVYADPLNSVRQQAAAPCRTTYAYLWGDGAATTRGAWPATSRAASVTHRYRSPGRYHVTARVEMNGKRVVDTRGSWECVFYTARKRWRAIAYTFDVTCPAGQPCAIATRPREQGLVRAS